MRKYKEHIRAANLLLQVLCGLKNKQFQKIQNNLCDMSSRYSQVSKTSGIFQKAVERQLFPSAKKLQSRIDRDLNEFLRFLEQLKTTVNADVIELPKSGDIVNELLQIEQEFGEIKIDNKQRTLSIITDPIVMDDIHLGAFEIRLFINEIARLHSESPYKVIALEPNYAGSDSNVTHPHVSHEKLCEGDGFMAIRKAIQQGRLYDFFQIIIQILQTYNPDSPYVSLEDWSGVSCYDCGYTVNSDDSYYCEDCENDFCSGCSTYCQICDTTVCLGCSYECPACMKPVCRDCATTCNECDTVFCKDCINEEGFCESCQEQREEQEYEEFEDSTIQPAIQPDSLGQTRIFA